ncbi:O-antigen ligase family protein [Paratractidigestivibacter faecalis]|uniref:O-antigen ligase family protein n=1 Tax=Paratractidigestivibacter faecalis TaxID=2292441 RepID=A0ABV1IEY4_9ACTN
MNHFCVPKLGVESSPELDRRFSLNDGSMVFIPLLFYAFFCQSLASSALVLDICLLLSAAAVFLYFIANRRFAYKRFGLELAWVPFFALFYIHSFIYGVSNMTLLVVYTLLFLCMYAAAGEQSWVTSCLRVLVAFAAFHAFCTIVFWLVPALYPSVKSAFFSGSYMARDYRSGFTAHYSTNSIYLSLGLVCWACGLVGSRKKARVKDLILGLILLLALFLTTKRGPLVASVAAIVASCLFVNRKKLTGTMLKTLAVAAIAVISVGVLATFVPAVQATLERFIELSDDGTGNGRSYLYDFAWSMFHANPLLGCGWGAYSKYVATTPLGAMYSNLGFSSMSTHNVYLQLLAETGVIGLISFVLPALLSIFAAMHHSEFLLEEGLYGNSFCLWACLGMQIFFLIYCFSGNPLYDPQCYIPYFTSCVAVFAICGAENRSSNC